jgi:hypothetical protein
MTVILHRAFVRGFCRAKAVLSLFYDTGDRITWLESHAPYDVIEADKINTAMREIAGKIDPCYQDKG